MKNQKGVVTIEFSIGFFVFCIFIFILFEISLIGLKSAVLDLALSESIRASKNQWAQASDSLGDDYLESFNEYKRQNKRNAIWKYFMDINSIKTHVEYYGSITELANGSQNFNTKSPIALYKIDYQYIPIFTSIFPKINFKREIVEVQEYERNKFHN
ncbi:hypothetical protein [Dongshaea marina]|uniref:hypothetical protein n=1 Tax=Dongshaea marina TaxID=2047966 RepID=UPI000D3E5A53|nr:hypothetical protein [Dongshaea marina]